MTPRELLDSRMDDFLKKKLEDDKVESPDTILRLHPKDVMVFYYEFPPYYFNHGEGGLLYGGFEWHFHKDYTLKPILENSPVIKDPWSGRPLYS